MNINAEHIFNAQLDVSNTYMDLDERFIINKGQVYFRADVIDEKTVCLANEVLQAHNEFLIKENERLNA